MDFSDDSPVTWTEFGSVLDASSGDLVMTTGSTIGPHRAFTDVMEWADVSIHTQIRLLEGELGSENRHRVHIGVGAAGAFNGGIRSDGGITIRDGLSGIDLASTMTGLDMFSSDIHLLFKVLGDTLSLSAWADGTPKPDIPQLMVAGITPFTEAHITMQGQRVAEGSTSRVVFRFVDVMVIPEPGTALLMGLGLVGLAAMKRREGTLQQ
jgi:hypothetical protein